MNTIQYAILCGVTIGDNNIHFRKQEDVQLVGEGRAMQALPPEHAEKAIETGPGGMRLQSQLFGRLSTSRLLQV